MTLTRARLSELRAIHNAATPPPWNYIPPEERSRRADECEIYRAANEAFPKSAQDEADDRCVAEARNALPELLDELESARATIDRVKGLMLQLKGHGPPTSIYLIEVPDAVLAIIDGGKG